jgi:hypothetical protein
MNFIKTYQDSLGLKECNSFIQFYKEHQFSETYKDNTVSEARILDSDFFENLNGSEILNTVEDNLKSWIPFPEKYHSFAHAAIMHHKANYSMNIHFDAELDYLGNDESLRLFIVLIYLNDDFTNGELLFPFQNVTIKPEAGMMAIFPTSFMYPHMTNPAVGNDRYVLRLSYFLNKKAYITR